MIRFSEFRSIYVSKFMQRKYSNDYRKLKTSYTILITNYSTIMNRDVLNNNLGKDQLLNAHKRTIN